jgi:hypothetical protein
MEQITQISQVFRTSLDQRSWALAMYGKVFLKLFNGGCKNVFCNCIQQLEEKVDGPPFIKSWKSNITHFFGLNRYNGLQIVITVYKIVTMIYKSL